MPSTKKTRSFKSRTMSGLPGGGICITGAGAFYACRMCELKTLVLDVEPEDDLPCDEVRIICDKFAGRDASMKENIELAQRAFKATPGSTEDFLMRDRCKVVMNAEWKRMVKIGQRSWEHIADEHNQLPVDTAKRAAFLQWMTPVSGIQAYCAHRLRQMHPHNTDELRDASEHVAIFFTDAPKSMPAFRVMFMASSRAYQGWLIVEPMTKEWFAMRTDERSGWIAGAMNISVRAAKQIKSDDQGKIIERQHVLPEHGLTEKHVGLEWLRFYNARPVLGDVPPGLSPTNMYMFIPNDPLGRHGWCPTNSYEEALASGAFLDSVTDLGYTRSDSTLFKMNLEFSNEARLGPLGSACMPAFDRGWVSRWIVGVTRPEHANEFDLPVVASEVVMTHNYADPHNWGMQATDWTMTSYIQTNWFKANPPPLREGVSNKERLSWFKGTWLAELLTHHCRAIETMVNARVAEAQQRIDEEVERQKRKELTAKTNASAFEHVAGLTRTQVEELAAREAATRSSSPLSFSDESMSDSDLSSEDELRTECRVASDKFAEQRAADKDKAPNMPPPIDLAKGSFSDCIHVVQEKKTTEWKKREVTPAVAAARAAADWAEPAIEAERNIPKMLDVASEAQQDALDRNDSRQAKCWAMASELLQLEQRCPGTLEQLPAPPAVAPSKPKYTPTPAAAFAAAVVAGSDWATDLQKKRAIEGEAMRCYTAATMIQAAWRGMFLRRNFFLNGMPPGFIRRYEALFRAELAKGFFQGTINGKRKAQAVPSRLTNDAQECAMAMVLAGMDLSWKQGANLIEAALRIKWMVLVVDDYVQVARGKAKQETTKRLANVLERVAKDGGSMMELRRMTNILRSDDVTNNKLAERECEEGKRWKVWLTWSEPALREGYMKRSPEEQARFKSRAEKMTKVEKLIDCKATQLANAANGVGKTSTSHVVLPKDGFIITCIGSTKQSILEAAAVGIEAARSLKDETPPPQETTQEVVPSWWEEKEVPLQAPLGTKRVHHATSPLLHNTSWVIGNLWPKHVTERGIPPRANNVIAEEGQIKYAKAHPQWEDIRSTIAACKSCGLVKDWKIVFSYTINDSGHEIVPRNVPMFMDNSVVCAFVSTLVSEVTLPDGRVDTLTFKKDDPIGDQIVEMHRLRIIWHTQKEAIEDEKQRDEAERASMAAMSLMLEEDREQLQKVSKAKKKADAKRARDKEQAEKTRLVREAAESAKQVLASKQAAAAAAHAEEQRRLAKAKKEERAREEAARFEAVLARKQAAEAEAAAEAAAAEAAEAEAAENAALVEAYALKEAQEAAERAQAEEADRVRLAQAEMMSRLRANTVPAPVPAPVTNGKGRGRANAGRGGRGGRGKTTPAPAPPPKPKEDDDSKLCVVCVEEDKSRVCVPCGHVCLCSNCATNKAIKTCPMCRAEITMVIPYFF